MDHLQSLGRSFVEAVDYNKHRFIGTALTIMMIPLCWNLIARLEYKTHFLTKVFCGHKYAACYFLAMIIFSFGLYRDYLFLEAIEEQATLDILALPPFSLLAAFLAAAGSIFVMSTYYRLGITGTYLGDYFGILLDEKVEGFPFTVMRNPMYNGSSMIFLGRALWLKSPAGIVLSALVFLTYRVAITFEESFTDFIYANRDKANKQEKKRA